MLVEHELRLGPSLAESLDLALTAFAFYLLLNYISVVIDIHVRSSLRVTTS